MHHSRILPWLCLVEVIYNIYIYVYTTIYHHLYFNEISGVRLNNRGLFFWNVQPGSVFSNLTYFSASRRLSFLIAWRNESDNTYRVDTPHYIPLSRSWLLSTCDSRKCGVQRINDRRSLYAVQLSWLFATFNYRKHGTDQPQVLLVTWHLW